ncbi:hypothetical protein Ndes2526A_g05540 [Nannochloris sp. 'desiccata']
MTVGFGREEEVFKYSVFIVLVNRLVTCAVAAVSLKILGQSLSPSAPLLLFAVPSVANVVGSSAQYEALRYVSFPLQALSKCAKSVPVMAWSWITQTRRYYATDYFSAATVTLGCVLFVLTGDITAPTNPSKISTGDSSSSAPVLSFTAVGLALLAVFMIFDGLTCTSQDKLFSSFDMHSCNQLLYTAAWSAGLSAGFLILSGQIHGAVHFILRHPDSLWLMLLQSAVSTAVQLFIVFTIKQYGALNFALMMTLRQFLSIVLSCLVFQHKLSGMQWIGAVFVIGGLLIRSLDKAATEARKHGGRGGKSLDSSDDTPVTPRGSVISGNTNGKSSGVFKGRGLDAERQPLLKNGLGGSGNLAHSIGNGVPSNIKGDSAIDVMMTPSTKLKSTHGGITSPRALIPIIAGLPPGTANAGNSHIHNINPLVNVLQPFGNVLTSPLRGPFRSTLAPAFPGSGELKEKPG